MKSVQSVAKYAGSFGVFSVFSVFSGQPSEIGTELAVIKPGSGAGPG